MFSSRLDYSYGSIQNNEMEEYLHDTLNWYMDTLKEMDRRCAFRGDIFSRACTRCHLDSPLHRFVSTGCGHIVCRDCADWTDKCLLCKCSSPLIALLEDPSLSRDCPHCDTPSPHERAVFSPCGHSVCSACAYHISFDAIHSSLPITCPFCCNESQIVHLIEEVIGSCTDNANPYDEIDDDSMTSSRSFVSVSRSIFPVRRVIHSFRRKIRKIFA